MSRSKKILKISSSILYLWSTLSFAQQDFHSDLYLDSQLKKDINKDAIDGKNHFFEKFEDEARGQTDLNCYTNCHTDHLNNLKSSHTDYVDCYSDCHSLCHSNCHNDCYNNVWNCYDNAPPCYTNAPPCYSDHSAICYNNAPVCYTKPPAICYSDHNPGCTVCESSAEVCISFAGDPNSNYHVTLDFRANDHLRKVSCLDAATGIEIPTGGFAWPPPICNSLPKVCMKLSAHSWKFDLNYKSSTRAWEVSYCYGDY